jgi:hypothetical protein
MLPEMPAVIQVKFSHRERCLLSFKSKSTHWRTCLLCFMLSSHIGGHACSMSNQVYTLPEMPVQFLTVRGDACSISRLHFHTAKDGWLLFKLTVYIGSNAIQASKPPGHTLRGVCPVLESHAEAETPAGYQTTSKYWQTCLLKHPSRSTYWQSCMFSSRSSTYRQTCLLRFPT